MSVNVKWIGNAFFTIKTDDKLIFTDPWVTNNPGAVLTVEEAAAMKPTHVLVSHGHPGHYGRGDSVAIANAAGCTYYSTKEVIRYVQNKGLLKTAYLGFEPGSQLLADGIEIEMMQVMHPPEPPIAPEWADLPGEPNTINMLRVNGKNLLHVGDTTLGEVYDYIAANYTVDLAMLPLWGKGMASNEKEAIRTVTAIIRKIKPRYVMLHNRWDPARPAWNSFFKANAEVNFASVILDQHPGVEVTL